MSSAVETDTTTIKREVKRTVPGCAQLSVQFIATDYTGSVNFQATMAPHSAGATAEQLRDCVYTVQGTWHGANQMDTRITTSLVPNPTLVGMCLLPRPPPAPSNAPYQVDATGHRRPEDSDVAAQTEGGETDNKALIIAVAASAVVLIFVILVVALYCKIKKRKASKMSSRASVSSVSPNKRAVIGISVPVITTAASDMGSKSSGIEIQV